MSKMCVFAYDIVGSRLSIAQDHASNGPQWIDLALGNFSNTQWQLVSAPEELCLAVQYCL